jgi:hypothetical protein
VKRYGRFTRFSAPREIEQPRQAVEISLANAKIGRGAGG